MKKFALLFLVVVIASSCEKLESPIETNEDFQVEIRGGEDIVFGDFEVDECCVTMNIHTNVLNLELDYPLHQVDIFDESDALIAYVSQGPPSQGGWLFDPTHEYPHYWVLEYCFECPGQYCFAPGIIGINASANVNNTNSVNNGNSGSVVSGGGDTQCIHIEEDCSVESCSRLCWEDFIGYFRCATSATFLINGQEVTIDFTEYTDGNYDCMEITGDPCDPFPIDSEVAVEGGYCAIYYQLEQIYSDLGFDPIVEFSDQDDCSKGEYSLPAFVFCGDDDLPQLISINGNDCEGGPELSGAPFNQTGPDCN